MLTSSSYSSYSSIKSPSLSWSPTNEGAREGERERECWRLARGCRRETSRLKRLYSLLKPLHLAFFSSLPPSLALFFPLPLDVTPLSSLPLCLSPSLPLNLQDFLLSLTSHLPDYLDPVCVTECLTFHSLYSCEIMETSSRSARRWRDGRRERRDRRSVALCWFNAEQFESSSTSMWVIWIISTRRHQFNIWNKQPTVRNIDVFVGNILIFWSASVFKEQNTW